MGSPIDPITSNVRSTGWAVVNVAGDDDFPAYAYSVGLYETFQHPEVIIFGLAQPVLHEVINAIGFRAREGVRLGITDTDENVLVGYRCAFRPVSNKAETMYMGLAVEYYGTQVPALHCIWPDKNGRFPWQSGTSPSFRRLQPMLSDGPEPWSRVRPGNVSTQLDDGDAQP